MRWWLFVFLPCPDHTCLTEEQRMTWREITQGMWCLIFWVLNPCHQLAMNSGLYLPILVRISPAIPSYNLFGFQAPEYPRRKLWWYLSGPLPCIFFLSRILALLMALWLLILFLHPVCVCFNLLPLRLYLLWDSVFHVWHDGCHVEMRTPVISTEAPPKIGLLWKGVGQWSSWSLPFPRGL